MIHTHKYKTTLTVMVSNNDCDSENKEVKQTIALMLYAGHD